MGEQQRICEWCSKAFTVTRSGPGRPPPYCSDDCKKNARRALNLKHVRAYRERKKGDPFDQPPAKRRG